MEIDMQTRSNRRLIKRESNNIAQVECKNTCLSHFPHFILLPKIVWLLGLLKVLVVKSSIWYNLQKMLQIKNLVSGTTLESTFNTFHSSPEVVSNLIPVLEAEAAQPPVCWDPLLVVDPSGIASILSFSTETKSVRASSSSLESPLTWNNNHYNCKWAYLRDIGSSVPVLFP